MPNYVPYRDDIETIDPDEQETHAKIIKTMTGRQHIRIFGLFTDARKTGESGSCRLSGKYPTAGHGPAPRHYAATRSNWTN